MLEEDESITDRLELEVFVFRERGRDSILDVAVVRIRKNAEDGTAAVAAVVAAEGVGREVEADEECVVRDGLEQDAARVVLVLDGLCIASRL